MVIDDGQLSITVLNATAPTITIPFADPYDSAKSVTINQLYNTLAGNGTNYIPGIPQVSGFSVQNLNPTIAPLGAIALIDGPYTLNANVYNNIVISTSLLWAFYKPIANMLEVVKGDVDLAIQQLGFVTAQGDFLDYWGGIFGIARFPNEPDYEYSIRLLWETIKPRLNNKALEELLLRGIGYQAQVVDLSPKVLLTDGVLNPILPPTSDQYADPEQIVDGWLNDVEKGFPDDPAKYAFGAQPYNFGSFGVYVDVPITSAFYQYTTDQLEQIVNRHRAAGTTPWFVINQVASELFSLINEVTISLEQAIDQEINEQRAMLFGAPDVQFYADHWSSTAVAQMPWEQDNLSNPSLVDNVVVEPQKVTIPAVYGTTVQGLFTNGSLADGFLGGFGRNLFHVDSFTSDHVDDFGFIKTIVSQYLTAQSSQQWVNNTVALNYPRVTDDYITPRIGEILSDDVMTVSISDVSGTISAWNGAGSLDGTTTSGDSVITSPIKVTAPVSITGVKFDAVSLTQQNLHPIPIVIPNLNIENFGEDWQENYAATRMWLVPVQDANGNRYYTTIILPWNAPPPIVTLQIANPTATIQSTLVLITDTQSVTISWAVTQSQNAYLKQYDFASGNLISITPVTFAGAITYAGATQITSDTIFQILAIGNNNQPASASIVVHVVQQPSTATAPTITAVALPSVVQLCDQNYTTLQYTVQFDSVQTEEQIVLFAADADNFVLSPLSTDPNGTVVMSSPTPIAARILDGFEIDGGWLGLGTAQATFIPLNPTDAQGYEIEFAYSVNYGGSSLSINGDAVQLPNNGELFQISQQSQVSLPLPANYIPGDPYFVNFAIQASNYASTSVLDIPVYVQPIQVGDGPFSVTSLSPDSLPEAIGNTLNETIQITAYGTGFSSNMQVYLKQRVLGQNGQQYQWQYNQASIVSIDWENGAVVFIAPRMTYGTYPISIWNLDCVGNVVGTDESQILTYLESTYRFPPVIVDLSPSVVCIDDFFVNQVIYITGHNFRAGAQVSICGPNGPVSEATTVINDTILQFLMDQNALGNYQVTVTNTDTSSGSTTGSPLTLTNSDVPVTINAFNYTPATNDSGGVQYGFPFVLTWNTTNASYITFSSNDSLVQAQLQSPDPNGWPGYIPGSVAVNIYSPGTTITLLAVNGCNNASLSTLTINDVPGEQTVGIRIIPTPIQFSELIPIKVHTIRLTYNPVTNFYNNYDITDDPDLTYNLTDNGSLGIVSLANKVMTPFQNGNDSITATWHGWTNTALIYVHLATPVLLTPTPAALAFSTLNQTFQLTVIATYGDQTERDVTQLCRYHGYDSTICAVNANGLVTGLANGSTVIQCDYTDIRVDPTHVVSTTVPFGPQDPILQIEQLRVSPEYAIAGQDDLPINFTVTGPNSQNATVMTDPSATADWSYVGSLPGTDTIKATLNAPAETSNSARILWINPPGLLCVSDVTGIFTHADSSGQFNWNGQNPLWSQMFQSLNFNPSGGIIDVDGTGVGLNTLPLTNILTNAANQFQSAHPCEGNGYAAGQGSLSSFAAIFTGNLTVKQAGNYHIRIYHDDGFVLGIGNDANLISGVFVNPLAGGVTTKTNLPLITCNNQRSIGVVWDDVIINFPSPGIYPFEFDYTQGGPAELYLFVTCFGPGENGLHVVPYVSLPAAIQNVPSNGTLSLAVENTSPYALIVGQTAQLEAKLQGLETIAPITLNLSIDNVRTVTINGVPVYNGAILDTWQYQHAEVLNQTKVYQVTASNSSGSVTAEVVANVVTFPAAVINWFYVYNPIINGPNGSSVAIEYGSPFGIMWNTIGATILELTDSVTGEVTKLPAAGTWYSVPFSSRNYTLTAFSANGTFVSQTITVIVNDYKDITHDWLDGNWSLPGNHYVTWPFYYTATAVPQLVKLGQNATVSLPEFYTKTPGQAIDWALEFWDGWLGAKLGLPVYANGTFDDWAVYRSDNLKSDSENLICSDGSRHGFKNTVQVHGTTYQPNDFNTVAPTTHTLYQFTSDMRWFWWIDDPNGFATIYWDSNRNAWWLRGESDWWYQDWVFSFWAAINVDPGPQFSYLYANGNNVNVGDPVTISYNAIYSVSLTGNFIGGENLPIGANLFVVYPDETTDYVFTATSPTGLVTQQTVHVDVTPQNLVSNGAALPVPSVGSVAVDGLQLDNDVLTIRQEENVHVLEIFGNHFLSDRQPTPEVIGKTTVGFSANGVTHPNLDLVEIDSVSNVYIRCKIATHDITVPANYAVYVLNDIGVSSESGIQDSFVVSPVIPTLIMNQAVCAHPGDTVTLWVDNFDAVRDIGLRIQVGTALYTPSIVGSNLSDTDFINQLYQAILNRLPTPNELALVTSQFDTDTITRHDLMSNLLDSSEYLGRNVDLTIGAGTPITVVIGAANAAALAVVTQNGTSPIQLEWIPIPVV